MSYYVCYAFAKGGGGWGMHYEVKREIAASPDAVWSIITDPKMLAEGGFGIIRIEGAIAPGASIKLWSEGAPKRAFPLKVSVFEPARRMVWEGGMPFGLFRGVRTFSLAPQGNATQFTMRETFSGLMLPLIARSMPDLAPSFAKFGDGLKRLAEG